MNIEFTSGSDWANAAERSERRRGAVGPMNEMRKGPLCPVEVLSNKSDVERIQFRSKCRSESSIPRSICGMGLAKRAHRAPLRVFHGGFCQFHIGLGQSVVQLTGHSARLSSVDGAIQGLIVVTLNGEWRGVPSRTIKPKEKI